MAPFVKDPEVDKLAEQGADFCRALRARADVAAGLPADKTFIDDLYESE